MRPNTWTEFTLPPAPAAAISNQVIKESGEWFHVIGLLELVTTGSDHIGRPPMKPSSANYSVPARRVGKLQRSSVTFIAIICSLEYACTEHVCMLASGMRCPIIGTQFRCHCYPRPSDFHLNAVRISPWLSITTWYPMPISASSGSAASRLGSASPSRRRLAARPVLLASPRWHPGPLTCSDLSCAARLSATTCACVLDEASLSRS